mgnify:CR=1 FL=1
MERNNKHPQKKELVLNAYQTYRNIINSISLEKQYNKIVETFEKNVSDEKQVKKVKKQLDKLIDIAIEDFSNVLDNYDEKMNLLEKQSRNNEERIRERKYALQDFLMELIDVIDIYDKAVSVKTDDEKLNKFLSGFIMINNRLKQILEHYEVKQIDALNKPFDPSFHSAIEAIKVDGVEPNTVVEVIITGYTYKDRVLRPSMVKVSE